MDVLVGKGNLPHTIEMGKKRDQILNPFFFFFFISLKFYYHTNMYMKMVFPCHRRDR